MRFLLMLTLCFAAASAQAAIGFVNSGTIPYNGGSATTTSATYTAVGGTNDLLVVCFAGSLQNNNITSVTYAGVPMTLAVTVIPANSGGGVSTDITFQYFLFNPSSASGATLTVTAASAEGLGAGELLEYSGVKPVSSPDATSTADPNADVSSVTDTITTVTNNDWAIMCGHNQNNGGFAASTGDVMRLAPDNYNAGFDSNGPISPAGAYSMTALLPNSPQHPVLAVAAYAPATGSPPAAPPMRTLTGVGQ